MAKPIENARLLLIQVREREDVEKQEQDCFIERCEIRRDQLDAVNVLHNPVPTWDQAAPYDVVVIGGAGVFSVTQDHPFNDPLTELVKRLCDADRPLFGACWGHQFAAQALGGAVITDHDRREVGTNTVELTAAGRADPLFAGLPPSFLAHMGHHDYTSKLPPGAVELATSQQCPNQAFRLDGKMVYGMQFHCELNSARLLERLTIYQHIYKPADDDLENLEQDPIPTPETDGLLRRFLELALAT